MADIIPPNPSVKVTSEGKMLQRFWSWTQFITRAVNFLNMAEGAGSPDGVLSSAANKFYRDTAGAALYWKSVNDIAGDTTLGWVLVV